MDNTGFVDFASAPRSAYRARIVSVNGIVGTKGITPLVDVWVDVQVPDHIDNVKDEVFCLAMRELHRQGVRGSLDANLWRLEDYVRQS
ncbi:hypothetical protein RKE25_23150 (plasmid) [Dyella sp. BiH032]|uniref:hypothetical protein n=1 Tax=Dyella sp. BiH032 TaxID=3075430 RepID=UPI0028936D27|nr:hypothetical protein [Dyella sp. BiH032]WNL48582.1 hypothetical protein RKE25_23150 [Dyella sp. BiH032]